MVSAHQRFATAVVRSLCACLSLTIWGGAMMLAPLVHVVTPVAAEGLTDASEALRNARVESILRQKCYACHSDADAAGDLRLDSLEGIRNGGHTGNAIIGANIQDSELVRRITSSDLGYRMPKEAEPLTAEEVAVIQQWVAAADSWNQHGVDDGLTYEGIQDPDSGRKVSEQNSTSEWLGKWWSYFASRLEQPRYRYPAWLAIPSLTWFVFCSACLRARFIRPQARNWFSSRLASVTIPRLSWAWAVMSAVGYLLYQYGLVDELRSANSKLKARLDRSTPAGQVTSSHADALAVPPYPMHPQRLGGVYFRGNDERSSSLFNGGFYRTATLEVWLMDSAGKKLAWNDPVSDEPLSVGFFVRRAAGTTEALFDQRVFAATCLRHFPNSEPNATNRYSLTETSPLQAWEAHIPLGTATAWNAGNAHGMIYVYYGPTTSDGQPGRAHFGISYSITIVDGKISGESELWMGSLYNLNGRVLIPDDNKILLDHWFDFRPIPEIEGENSTDPELLGTPEHQKP